MGFLGIDVGTTGCKSVVFSETGAQIASDYVEYDISRSAPGYAELDAPLVWTKISNCIRTVAEQVPKVDPIQSLAVASLGEAMVPVDTDRNILGSSILNIDLRGNEYLAYLREGLSDRAVFDLNGNSWGEQYGATKLMWLKRNRPELYARTDYFLHWGSLVSFMLGAEPTVDYSLANRSMLFDINSQTWSQTLLSLCALDEEKLPRPVPSGTVIGTVSNDSAQRCSLPTGIPIVSGAHDQCANATGSGVVNAGRAMYGMGTFPTLAPIYSRPGSSDKMLELGLNVEHHTVSGLFATFIFHMGGSIIKWYRDLLQNASHSTTGQSEPTYDALFSEIDHYPSGLLVLPHFVPMGPPDFISDQTGLILGLTVDTKRSHLLQAIVEANSFALNIVFERLPEVGIAPDLVTVVGGGSKSDAAVQINANIFNKPLTRPNVTEAGALGAAILSATAIGTFDSLEQAADAMITIDRVFEPEPVAATQYREVFEHYKETRETMGLQLRRWAKLQHDLS